MTKVQIYTGEYLEKSLEELLDEIVLSIKSLYSDCRIILFGSFARGDQTKDSDIDLCVLVPELLEQGRDEMEVEALYAIRQNLGKIFLPYELLVYTFAEFEEDKDNKSLVQSKIYEEGMVLAG